MSQLSRVSGVAVGTIYHHFSSKDELIEGLFLYIQEQFGKEIKLSDKEQGLPFKRQFELILKKSFQFYIQNPLYFFFVHAHNYSPLISPEITQQGREFYKEAIALLLEGMDRGLFEKTHPSFLIRWVYNSLISLVEIQLIDDVPVSDQLFKNTSEIIWNGLQKQNS